MKKMNLERQWRNLVGDSDDKEIFEGFEPADIYIDKTLTLPVHTCTGKWTWRLEMFQYWWTMNISININKKNNNCKLLFCFLYSF